MSFISAEIFEQKLPALPLGRDVTIHLKRGHRWIFADCFNPETKVPSGLAMLKLKSEVIGLGVVQADTQLRFRLFTLARPKENLQQTLTNAMEENWRQALSIRKFFNTELTNAFRLINGEGDGMPGLVIDLYSTVAVIKHDHPVMEKVWNYPFIVLRLRQDFPQLQAIYLKRDNRQENKGDLLWGELPEQVRFLENGVHFTSNIRDAAKTGFFLDQRENRWLISQVAKDCRVLNLFSYTGGFSLLAAKGGASEVTSMDISVPAIEAVDRNFALNSFSCAHHEKAQDVFEFLQAPFEKKDLFDLVIADPPSFAPNQKSVEHAHQAYVQVFAQSLKRVRPGGLFAASSCSAHISFSQFEVILREAFSKARLKGQVLAITGQPFDHPFPLAMEELRYLKFALTKIS